jgi:hypothetical protein
MIYDKMIKIAVLEQALIQLIMLEDALRQEMAKNTDNAEHFYELFWEIMERGEQKYERITRPHH